MSDVVEKPIKMIRCVVRSASMNKSRVGEISRMMKHPRVHKYLRRRTRVMFHDEQNNTKVGDEVLIKQTRPLSKRKSFTLVEVVKRSME